MAASYSRFDAIVAAYHNSGPQSDAWQDTVWDQNPNAIDMAMDRLGRVLKYGDLGDEGETVLEALEGAQRLFEIGEYEVEADASAAGDR